jgi:hypothetical protein
MLLSLFFVRPCRYTRQININLLLFLSQIIFLRTYPRINSFIDAGRDRTRNKTKKGKSPEVLPQVGFRKRHDILVLIAQAGRITHWKKKVSRFPVPSRDVTYQTLPGRALLIIHWPGRVWFDIPDGDGKTANFFTVQS